MIAIALNAILLMPKGETVTKPEINDSVDVYWLLVSIWAVLDIGQQVRTYCDGISQGVRPITSN